MQKVVVLKQIAERILFFDYERQLDISDKYLLKLLAFCPETFQHARALRQAYLHVSRYSGFCQDPRTGLLCSAFI